MPELTDRLSEFCRSLGCPTPEAFDALVDAYQHPPRAYHNLDHIRACLEELDTVRGSCNEPNAVEAAIWFHDAIYDARRSDNEQQSAQLARRVLSNCGMSAAFCDRVERLILATRHDRPPGTPDEALIIDIDLSILGQPPHIFDAYERAIREEYAFVSEPDFRAGRSKVLQRFLDCKQIYSTEGFRARYEAAARANLERSLRRLREARPS